MKLVVMVGALLVFGCGKDSDDGTSSAASPAESTADQRTAPPLGDDPEAAMSEMLALMTELSETAGDNKGSCDQLGKAMHEKLDALMPRMMQVKAASARLEKQWAGKTMDERMEIMSRMPQIEKMAEVSETTRTILDDCADNAEVARFEQRLAKLIGP